MKCPYSGKPCLKSKEIQVTENRDGKSTKLFLCNDCGIKYVKMPEADVTSTTSQIKSSSSGTITSEVVVSNSLNQPCPKCGTTAAQILEQQAFGCDVCSIFHSSIEEFLAQQKIKPLAPTPSKKSRFHVGQQVQMLEEQLKVAIKKEDYEQASLLRDAINALNVKLDGTE